jgi:hypothetical protein
LQLHVLPLLWPDLGFRYTMAESWPILARTDLTKSLLVLGVADIQTYDWTNQEIWLTDTCLQRMRDTNTARLVLDTVGRGFVVTLEGTRLYGGLLIHDYGAAAIRFPVIHAVGPSRGVLRVRPALGNGWTPANPYVADQCRVIANPRLADWLRAKKLLSDGPPSERPREPWPLSG